MGRSGRLGNAERCAAQVQPCAVGGVVEQRGEPFAHAGMVIVEPCGFGRVQQGRLQQARIDGAQRQRFESQERAEFAETEVLDI